MTQQKKLTERDIAFMMEHVWDNSEADMERKDDVEILDANVDL